MSRVINKIRTFVQDTREYGAVDADLLLELLEELELEEDDND